MAYNLKHFLRATPSSALRLYLPGGGNRDIERSRMDGCHED